MQKFIDILDALGIADNPGLVFCPQIEGYHDYTFGSTAGPNKSPLNLLHELAHASQFGPENFSNRCINGEFRFKVKDVNNIKKTKMTMRELDTFAHQLHLMDKANFYGDFQSPEHCLFSFANTAQWLPDWYNFSGNKEENIDLFKKIIMEKYNAVSQATVLDKLVSWLSLTVPRLEKYAIPQTYFRDYFNGLGQKIQNSA